jgi:NADH-quinone oxidoreductase subunit D
VARGAGCDFDVRRDEPYLAYGELDFQVPLGSAGDVADRTRVRLEEMGQSLAMARQCLEAMPAGPTLTDATPTPTTAPTGAAELIHHFERWMDGHGYRPQAGGQVYLPTESADGELAIYVVSDGTAKPARAHLRSPSLFHFQALPDRLIGVRRSSVSTIVASFNIVASEMDR